MNFMFCWPCISVSSSLSSSSLYSSLSSSLSCSWRIRRVSCSLILKKNLVPPSHPRSSYVHSFILVYIVTLALVFYLCPFTVRVVATFPGTDLFPLLYSVLPLFPNTLMYLGIIFVNYQLDAQFFFVYVYSNFLPVSSTHVLIIRRINCICTSGIRHFM